jgi:transcriptional regulator GlxA family with amidase domain
VSERQFRRHCHHHFGYGAKTLTRIRRFQTLLGLCGQEVSQSLAMLAVAAGYADQAHMNREVREISTLTPLELRRQIAG